MKMYTHAWLGLKAVDLLKSYHGRFCDVRNKRLKGFLEFISKHPTTFVRGAWFPDNVIRDNTQGGHTWKYSLDSVNGRTVSYRPPAHNKCMEFVAGSLSHKVSLNARVSDLPDRCEALGQTIRDSLLMTKKFKKGDVVAFNDSQIAIFLLMLSHYICDAHVPVHSDNRDFYGPSKVHPDLEDFWEKEIKKYYRVSSRARQFDLDADQMLQRDTGKSGFEDSILYKCDRILEETEWDNIGTANEDWRVFLGSTNNNFWDYMVGVCLVSFHMSVKLFPIDPPAGVDYDNLRIMEVEPFKDQVTHYSPYMLADAINSVALLWLASWERWGQLEDSER